MLQHRTAADLDPQTSTTPLPIVGHPIVEPTCVENEQIEDLLDKVCARLVERTPYGRRTELRAEMRQHLHALAQAYEELGESPEQAVALAVEKFGKPEQVAREWSAPLVSARSRSGARDWFRSQWRGMGAVASLCILAGWLGFALHGGTAVTAQSTGVAGTGQQRAESGPLLRSGQPLPRFHQSAQFMNCAACHRSEAPVGNIRNQFRNDLPPAHLWSKP